MKDSTIILIVLVLAFVIISPSIFTGFGDLLDRIGNWVQYGSDFGTSTSLNPELVIHYKDGSTKNFTETTAPFMIEDPDGNTVESIDVYCKATLSYKGTLTDYSGTLTWEVSVNTEPKGTPLIIDSGDGGEGNIGTVTSGNSYPSGTSWQSGTVKTLKTFSVTETEIENVVQGKADGTYYLWFEIALDVTVTFENGSTDSKTGIYASASWQFDFVGGEITSLSVSFSK